MIKTTKYNLGGNKRHLFAVFITHGYAWKFHLSQLGRTSSIMLSFCTKIKMRNSMYGKLDEGCDTVVGWIKLGPMPPSGGVV